MTKSRVPFLHSRLCRNCWAGHQHQATLRKLGRPVTASVRGDRVPHRLRNDNARPRDLEADRIGTNLQLDRRREARATEERRTHGMLPASPLAYAYCWIQINYIIIVTEN